MPHTANTHADRSAAFKAAFVQYMDQLALARYGRAVDAAFDLDGDGGFTAYKAADLALKADHECTRALEETLSPQTMLAMMALAIEGGVV